jgi:hypothetical protein
VLFHNASINKADFYFLCLEKTAICLSSCSSANYKRISVLYLLNFTTKALLNTKDISIGCNELIKIIFIDSIRNSMLAR